MIPSYHSHCWVESRFGTVLVSGVQVMYTLRSQRNTAITLRPRPHEYVFKSNLRFHFTENGMKVLRPHGRFLIVLPVHTETIKATETLLAFYCACVGLI